jgi:activator of HSP90 ATPase
MKTIKQHYFINAAPEEVFSAITNPFTIELWSGYTAKMEAKEGTEFSIFDGDIIGRNIKVVENQQLIQEWYFGENPGESMVTIDLKPHQLGTKVSLEHTNVPDEEAGDFAEGWKNYYWGAIKDFFK